MISSACNQRSLRRVLQGSSKFPSFISVRCQHLYNILAASHAVHLDFHRSSRESSLSFSFRCPFKLFVLKLLSGCFGGPGQFTFSAIYTIVILKFPRLFPSNRSSSSVIFSPENFENLFIANNDIVYVSACFCVT